MTDLDEALVDELLRNRDDAMLPVEAERFDAVFLAVDITLRERGNLTGLKRADGRLCLLARMREVDAVATAPVDRLDDAGKIRASHEVVQIGTTVDDSIRHLAEALLVEQAAHLGLIVQAS